MRVVLVRLSALGDIIHTWPLAVALRDADAHIHLSWVVEEHFRPLVDGHPAVDSVFTTRTRAWRRRPFAPATRAEIRILKSRFQELQPDLAIDSQGLIKSAIVCRWTGAGRRVGLERPWRRERMAGFAYSDVVPGAVAGSHVAATNLALMRAVGGEPPALTSPDGSWLLDRARHQTELDFESTGPYAVLLPGAGGAHKVLPETTLAAVARELAEEGLRVVVAWGPGEEARAHRVVAAAGGKVRLAPPTNLLELTCLLGGAKLVVGGDTGPTHLAASLSVPTVAFYLASDWRRNGPLGASTSVVSGVTDPGQLRSGSAKARPSTRISASEIVAAAIALLGDRE